ncbi:MAG: hypothetical protein EOM88_04695, partial [Clostridia bacterium]|nr:hypothetical protein [Clostridia bacterium]
MLNRESKPDSSESDFSLNKIEVKKASASNFNSEVKSIFNRAGVFLNRCLGKQQSEEIFGKMEEKYQNILQREIFLEDHPDQELLELREYKYLDDSELKDKLIILQEYVAKPENQGQDLRILAETFEAIEQETDFFSNISGTINKIDLLAGLDKTNFDVPVHFNIEGLPAGGGINTGKVIGFADKAPSACSMLEQLASDSTIMALNAIHHELVHSKDNSNKITDQTSHITKLDLAVSAASFLAVGFSAFFDKSGSTMPLASMAALAAVLNTSLLAKSKSQTSHFLTETHAYLANRRIGADMNTTDLVKHLYANYGLKNEADADKVFLASDGIQKLYALGLND